VRLYECPRSGSDVEQSEDREIALEEETRCAQHLLPVEDLGLVDATVRWPTACGYGSGGDRFACSDGGCQLLGIDGSEVGEASLHEVEPLEEVGGTESRLAAGSADDDAQASTDSAYSEFDTFTFLFPDAEELASTIRAGEAIPAGPVPASGWPPDCGIDEAEILDGEEVLGTTSLFFQGDLPVFGLLYVGSTSWTLVEAHTCETFTWPPAHD
jgi:hypothetical protein